MISSLSDLLNQTGGVGVNPLAFLTSQSTGTAPQPAPIDPTGASVLPAAAPGNVLAKLSAGGMKPPAPPPVGGQGLLFGGVPDVRGMSRGAAFASGLGSGLSEGSKNALLSQQARQTDFQNNLALYKMLFEQQNTQATQAEQARRDTALENYYKAQTDPELQGKLDKAKTEAEQEDVVADAEERGKVLDAAGIPRNSPEGKQFYASGAFPTKGPTPPLNPKEEDAVLKANTKVDALTNSLDTLKQARKIITDNGDIYSGYTGDVAQWVANKLPGNVSAMAVDQDKAARTTAFNNAIQSAVLPQAKDNFGARVSNYEERIMQNLAPTSSISPQARSQILDTLIHRREAALAGEYQTLDDIKSRKMFQPGYRAPNPYENWNPEQDFNPGGKPVPTAAPSGGVRKAAPPSALPSAPDEDQDDEAAGAAGVPVPAPPAGGSGIVSSATAAPAGPVRVNSPEEAAKLPKGTMVVLPDGRKGQVK